nr:MAG: internal scaffolding protein [Microvirus sp.]
MKKRLDPTLSFKKHPTMTQQHFAEEVNINSIVAKFSATGEFPMAQKQAEYGVSTGQTFTEAMHLVSQATNEFMTLPANIRAYFNHDPASFLDAASDETQRPLFEEMGLLEPLEVETQKPPTDAQTPAETYDPASLSKANEVIDTRQETV